MVLALLLSSCSGSADEPSEPELGSAPVVVSLKLDTAMVASEVFDTESRAADGLQLRCQVRAYAETAQGQLSAKPSGQAMVTFTAAGQQGDIRMVLPSGRYRILAWADYVNAGSTADKYYTTTDFTDITLRGSYEGNTDGRNAYMGSAAVNFNVPVGDTTTVVREQVSLRSVMGKVRFVTTDYNEWLAKDPQNLRILVAYTGFLPHRYSVPRGVPFDATTGINFLSAMSEISTEGDGSATMATDYVMVNGEQSSVSMALGLYDDSGKLVGSTSTINVPLHRGGITTVTGHFLTKTASGGGIGINPNFDGDINVYF